MSGPAEDYSNFYDNYDDFSNYDQNFSDYMSEQARSLTIWEQMGAGCGILMMIVCVLGIFGNILSIVIFTHRRFRHISINNLLTALSAADLCLLFLAFPTFVLPPVSRMFSDKYMTILSKLNVLNILYCYPVTTMFHTASVWLLIVVTVERWCAVKHPLVVKILFTRRRAFYIMVIVYIASLLYNVVRFWEFKPAPPPNYIDFNLRAHNAFLLWYVNVAGILTTYVIPLSVHCLLNCQVVHAMYTARQSRRQLSFIEKREMKTARIMAAVVLVFVFCDSFSFALNIWEQFNQEMFQRDRGLFLSDVNNLLVIFNSASTWIFYIKYSTRYRAQAKRLLYGLVRKKDDQEIIETFSKTTIKLNLLQKPRSKPKVAMALAEAATSASSVVIGQRRAALISRKDPSKASLQFANSNSFGKGFLRDSIAFKDSLEDSKDEIVV